MNDQLVAASSRRGESATEAQIITESTERIRWFAGSRDVRSTGDGREAAVTWECVRSTFDQISETSMKRLLIVKLRLR
jgi:hypothetical protein